MRSVSVNIFYLLRVQEIVRPPKTANYFGVDSAIRRRFLYGKKLAASAWRKRHYCISACLWLPDMQRHPYLFFALNPPPSHPEIHLIARYPS